MEREYGRVYFCGRYMMEFDQDLVAAALRAHAGAPPNAEVKFDTDNFGINNVIVRWEDQSWTSEK